MKDTYGFDLVREQHIPELNAQARLFRHRETGAELLSLQNEDENKVFGVTFRTPPPDSTGIPHIMEHSVLCGSRKYPVKEPFVELMKGSLNTFLNAMTFPDKTCYPVASQNVQDFENLIEVYMDAVFFPRLNPYTLMQEGWHYELDDARKSLAYKGVVFNEMKGAYSQPENLLDDQIRSSLFPDTIYRHDSGGNPSAIPDLTFEQFQDFHQTYYHPSNARIFFYGDYDLERQLMLTDEYLRLFDPLPVRSVIDLQPAFAEPRRHVEPYEISADQQDAKAYVTVNWLLPEAGDVELTFALAVLEQVLIGTPAAQLRKALIDSGLGEDLAGSGMETGSRQMYFSTGLKGVDPANVDRVEQLILDTLAGLALNGVDPENVAAALNTIEFRLRENNTGSYPRGLLLMLRSLEFWLHDKDPLSPLAFEAPLDAIKTRLAAGEPLFEHLIEAYLVSNNHRTTVILTPDAGLAERRAAAERERLDRARQAMSDEEVQAVIDTAQTLKERQEAPDSPEMLMTIPLLDRDDLDKEIRRIPVEELKEGQSTVLFHDLFTNGILYLDLGFDMHALPQDWIPYIPLFGRALTETGTQAESFVQLLQRIGRTTGGIRHTTLTSARRQDGESVAWFFLRGKAMLPQTGDLLCILNDVLTGARLEDRERFRQMALEEKARLESRLIQAGHALVNGRLRARFNEADWAAEQMGGISYLFFLRQLAQQIESDWQSVLNTLQSIRDILLSGRNALANVTLDAASWQSIRPQLDDFLANLPDHEVERKTWRIPGLPPSEGLTIPAQVNYVGKGANLFAHGYTLKGSAFVINNHLNGTFLWDKIRVQGGAYGGFGVFDNQSGVYTFLSYRDPNLGQTLENYDAAGQYLRGLELDETELTKAIIGTIGDLDAYQLPDAKGFTALRFHLLGLTDQERQRLRDEVLGTTQKDFRQFADVLEQVKEHGQVVVLGADEALKTSELFDEIKKVM
jgi:Zn-dependent M16 (insulinase) family peptidase